MTYFQQKWRAKSVTRAYHGERLPEKHWKRIFHRGLRSVVAIPDRMGQTDGSEHGAGRGSGLDQYKAPKELPAVPYMNMLFAPMERRLDIAIFRAMFASSARQARQFVTHGYVKVNGSKMIYPGYMLNPGDMFQVEPERVLFATGAPKSGAERRRGRQIRKQAQAGEEATTSTTRQDESEPMALDDAASQQATPESSLDGATTDPSPDSDSPEAATETTPRETLRHLLTSAKSALAVEPGASAKRKRNLRDFVREVRKHISRGPSSQNTDVAAQLTELAEKFSVSLSQEPSSSADPSAPSSTPTDEAQVVTASASKAAQELQQQLDVALSPARVVPQNATPQTFASDALRTLKAALAEARDNPIDSTKPYATPWRPRDWMAPFAFIPRYLEVHHKICAAVYLRHPVARHGSAEVPTPFGNEMNGLTYNWYLRRR